MEERNKKIDENWKNAVEKEKGDTKNEESDMPIEPDFNFFITSLGLQSAIALGSVANPLTNKKEENLKQAKFMIDNLSLLQNKTKGNLTKEEEGLLENILYELRVQYIEKTKNKS